MKYIGKDLKATICLIIYYTIAYHLPQSHKLCNIGGFLRYLLCKNIFLCCGVNVNIEKHAYFGNGAKIEIGNNSGIGVNAVIPSTTKIGDNVMMGPNCYVLERNHNFERIDIPICQQGYKETKFLVIEDDVWIGRDCLILPGRTIKSGTIVAAGCVLCKDFPPFSIIGGNPSKLIKSRK